MRKQILRIAIGTAAIAILFYSLSFADDFVAGQAIVSYLRVDGQEVYNPSNIVPKQNERAAFCTCVMAIPGMIPNTHAFDSCSPIHLVLPNLPSPFISNRLLNEVVVHSNLNLNPADVKYSIESSCASTFTVEYSTYNFIFDIGAPNSTTGGSGGIGSTAAVGDPMVPNDPYFNPYQWGLQNTGQNNGTPDADIDAPEAWGIIQGSGDIIVAVIDTGVDYNHPDLQGRMWVSPQGHHGFNFVNPNDPDNPMDTYGHGTEIAGIIAASMNNASGMAGVCPNCKIMALKVAEGQSGIASDKIQEAIVYATLNGADIINMSFFNSNPSAYAELNTAYQSGLVLTACAGNYSPTAGTSAFAKRYPAAFGTGIGDTFDVISVAATDKNNAKATNFNCTLNVPPYSFTDCATVYSSTWMDISAPGEDILSSVPVSLSDSPNDDLYDSDYQGYYESSGSSYSTAHVSGVAALILSMNPDWQNQHICSYNSQPPAYNQPCSNVHDYIRDIMKKNAFSLPGLSGMGAGLLNAGSAIADVHSLPGQNLPPVFGALPLLINGVPGVPSQFDIVVNDANDTLSPGGALNVTMVTGPPGATFDLPGDPHRLMFRWTPQSNQDCPESCVASFKADDGVNNAVFSRSVNFEVGPNQPPVADAGPDNDFVKEKPVPDGTTSFSIGSLASSDPDGDYIFYEAWDLPSGFTLHPGSQVINDPVLNFIATPDVVENTYYTFTMNVCDRNPLFANPAALCDSDDMRIRLLAKNDPPEFIVMPPSSMQVHVGDPVNFDLFAQDPNPTDTLTIGLSSIPPGVDNVTASTLVFNPSANSAHFQWTPMRADYQGNPFSPVFNFVVTDSGLNSPSLPLSDIYDVTINVQNEGPSLTPAGSISWIAGRPFEMNWNVTDPDGDDVLSMTGSGVLVSLNGVPILDSAIQAFAEGSVQTSFDTLTDVFTVQWPNPFLLAQPEWGGGTDPNAVTLTVWAVIQDEWYTKSVFENVLTMRVYPNETQAPSVTISTPSGGNTTSGQAVASITDNSQLKWLRFYIDQSPVTNPQAVPLLTQPISGTNYPFNYTPSVSLSYASHTYYVQAEDLAGNKYTASRAFTYISSSSGNPPNSGSSGCFLPGTPITMADGTTKSIESVVIGDKVLAYDETAAAMAEDTVAKVFIHNDVHNGYFEINDMKVTDEHPLWIKDKGWVKAGEVKVGDALLRQDGTPEPVTHIKFVDGKYTVHNLETQPHHTYYAQGKRVHNKTALGSGIYLK